MLTRPGKIDRETADRARNKTKSVFKGNGGLTDLTYEELLVLLADVTTELNIRNDEAPQAGVPVVYGPLRNFARKILI